LAVDAWCFVLNPDKEDLSLHDLAAFTDDYILQRRLLKNRQDTKPVQGISQSHQTHGKFSFKRNDGASSSGGYGSKSDSQWQ
jgi:hypothetical protein